MREVVDQMDLNTSYDIGGGCELMTPWASPVIVKRNLGTDQINQVLNALGRDMYQKIYKECGSFSHKSVSHHMRSIATTDEQIAAVEWLDAEVREAVEQYLYAHGADLDDLMIKNKISINLQQNNCAILEHTHIGSDLVVVYYPEVKVDMTNEVENAGALVFSDPRPVPSNYLLRSELSYRVVNVETGMLVVFPGHLRHSTIGYANAESSRLAITNDLLIRSKKYHGAVEW